MLTKDLALKIFYGMYDWLKPEQRSVINSMHSGHMTVSEAGMKVGPNNAEKWERDLTVINDALEVLQMGGVDLSTYKGNS